MSLLLALSFFVILFSLLFLLCLALAGLPSGVLAALLDDVVWMSTECVVVGGPWTLIDYDGAHILFFFSLALSVTFLTPTRPSLSEIKIKYNEAGKAFDVLVCRLLQGLVEDLCWLVFTVVNASIRTHLGGRGRVGFGVYRAVMIIGSRRDRLQQLFQVRRGGHKFNHGVFCCVREVNSEQTSSREAKGAGSIM